MKRRSFFKSIAAVFGAVAAAPAVALTKAPAPVARLPELPTKANLSGNYIINGEQCFVEADGTVVRWDKEAKDFSFGEKRKPMPIHRYNGDFDYWRERELKVS